MMAMTQKNKAGSMILGVAFVWFTTHFGGGFASGAQIYSYYVRYGIWCLIMPAAAMLYNTVFFAYCLRFARKHEVYDYRSYNNAFYGKFSPVFSNLFEILYLCVMCVAPAVAFATGGATLSALTGLPYLLCTFVIGVFIFIVAIFGTDLVRKVASVLSVCIIAGLLIVYIPNIAAASNGKRYKDHYATVLNWWRKDRRTGSQPRPLKQNKSAQTGNQSSIDSRHLCGQKRRNAFRSVHHGGAEPFPG